MWVIECLVDSYFIYLINSKSVSIHLYIYVWIHVLCEIYQGDMQIQSMQVKAMCKWDFKIKGDVSEENK